MQANIPQEGAHYERIIELMQTCDCSYEEAERHFLLLHNAAKADPQLAPPPINQMENEEELDQEEELGGVEEVLRGLDVIPFTARELRTLKLFFSGTLSFPKKGGKTSFCEKTVQAIKAAKRKMKCFKYLNPKRLWKLISRRKRNYNYNRIGSKDPSSPQSESAKTDQPRFERWEEPETDWVDDLEQIQEELASYLSVHKELTNEVKAMGGEGLRVTVPTEMDLPPTLQPFLFIREGSSEIIADNVKELAEKIFKVVCIEKQHFALLHNSVSDFSEAVVCSIGGYNIFSEIQILSALKGLTAEDVERGQGIFKQFLIKNRLFKSLISRQITRVSFAIAEPQEVSQEEDEEEDEEEVARRKEMEAHQKIIREQDMLYQSMLSSYVNKQTEQEKENGSAMQSIKKRQAIKQSIKEEPTPGHSTVHITFRTPTGSTVSRNFHKQDSIEYVRSWIMTQQQVQFQSKDATFQLYHGYPPTRVEAGPNQTLSETFGDEEAKIKVIIKQQ